VCDCCDATDEWETGACSNTCEEAGRELRAAQALARERQAEGGKIREAMIAEGKALVESQTTEVAELRPSLDVVEAEKTQTQTAKDQAEEPEKVAKEAADGEWEMTKSEGIESAKKSLFVHLDHDASETITLDEIPLKIQFDSDSGRHAARSRSTSHCLLGAAAVGTVVTHGSSLAK
jgi:hypothetical protein